MDLTDLYFHSSPLWQVVMVRVETVAPTGWPLLLAGGRGSGKSLLARYIAERSCRPGSFVLGPAPSIPDTLVQSEMRGYDKGAFTDAKEARKGALELAHQGTLFLDEIEAASYGLQSFLVGQVEQGEVCRLGESRARAVDVRYIYATNADLELLAEQGRFRRDLLDRIAGVVIRVPPLAACTEAILPLARRFIREDLDELGRGFAVDLTMDTQRMLLRYSWPGNIRELRGACREAAISLSQARALVPEDFPLQVSTGPVSQSPAETRVLREQVAAILREVRGNKAEAARRLNLSRPAFHRLLERLNRSLPDDGIVRSG